MKRFYTLVSISDTESGHVVCLDGKPIKTPMRHTLAAPTKALALAIQKEWAAQGEMILPQSMPVTQITSTCLDRIAQRDGEAKDEIKRYFESDLLYFRTNHPPELIQRQNAVWNPWTEWAQDKFGTLPKTTTSLTVPAMPPATMESFAAFLDQLEPLRLTVMALMTATTGSAILAAALLTRAISADQVFDAVFCEELFYVDLYDIAHNGPDPAQEKKQNAVIADVKACIDFLAALDD